MERLYLALLLLTAVLLVIDRLTVGGGVFYALGFGPLQSWVWSSFVAEHVVE